MEHNESNFFYLKSTSMNKYYDELFKAECICEYYPKATKTIVRKVLEKFLKDLAEKELIEADTSVWSLFNNIKLNSKINFTEEIYNYIETILVNGYEHVSHSNVNRKISKHPIEILEMMHNILCWYLKQTEIEIMMSFTDLSFRAPSTIEYMEKQLSKIKSDIILKNKQINNLRQKIIEFANKGENVGKINNVTISIKEEKAYLEKVEVLLSKKIAMYKKYVSDMEISYKAYIKKYEDLNEKCNENQSLLFEKESKLVKIEIQKQEINNLIKELDDDDDDIIRMKQQLEEEMNTLRQAYENLLSLTNEYQDIIETIEFSYDKELQNILEMKRKNIKIKMNFEDGVFNENIVECMRNISEIKRKTAIFKELVNEKIIKEIKYDEFYRSFLGLQGNELRTIYTIVNVTINLVSKYKELFWKSSEDRILESINRNLEELKNVNDDEIKLILYYRLMKLSQISFGRISSRKKFVENLNKIVDKAYEILVGKNDFKGRIKKLDAIMAYNLEKVVFFLKSKNGNRQISEELIIRIYNEIILLKQKTERMQNIYYEKFNLNTMLETELKANIKSQPYTFLTIMVDLGDANTFKEICEIIFEIYNVPAPKIQMNSENKIIPKFSVLRFMVLLFLSNETISSLQKQPEDVVPLLVSEIITTNLLSVNEITGLENYNRMVDLWKRKQLRYNDFLINRENEESLREQLINEKKELEIQGEELLKNYNTLIQRYCSYTDEFKQIIMNSEKRILLPSYLSYDELRTKKEKAEKNINKSKDKFGSIKSIVSPSVWKEQASKFFSESNMEYLEKQLIEEAKLKPYFKKEYLVFFDLEEKIKKANELLGKNKKDIQDKEILIDNVNSKINELDRKLNNIKEAYGDIEE